MRRRSAAARAGPPASSAAAACTARAARRGAAARAGRADGCASCRDRVGLADADRGEPVADAPDILDPALAVAGGGPQLQPQPAGVAVERARDPEAARAPDLALQLGL